MKELKTKDKRLIILNITDNIEWTLKVLQFPGAFTRVSTADNKITAISSNNNIIHKKILQSKIWNQPLITLFPNLFSAVNRQHITVITLIDYHLFLSTWFCTILIKLMSAIIWTSLSAKERRTGRKPDLCFIFMDPSLPDRQPARHVLHSWLNRHFSVSNLLILVYKIRQVV